MHIELGSGKKRIFYYNEGKDPDIDVMFCRIADAYKERLSVGYPDMIMLNRDYRVIFTSEAPDCNGLRIGISKSPCGIYTDNTAYHEQLARSLFHVTGWNLYHRATSCADLEIGIGDLNASTQGYVMLQDAILGFVT